MADNNIDILINQLKRIKNDWPKVLENIGHQAVDIAVSKAVLEMAEQFRPKFNEVVDDFYNSYTPSMYARRGSMYEVLKLSTHFDGSDATLSMDWGDDEMTFRDNKPGLMELTFGEGYHGGARGTDNHGVTVETPWYRTPPYWDYWYFPANQSESPYDRFMEWVKEYWEGPTFQALFEKYCKSEFEKGLNYNLLFG